MDLSPDAGPPAPEPAPEASDLIPRPTPTLAQRTEEVGGALARALDEVLAALPEAGRGPQALARTTGLDKVFASRLLKAARQRDPLALLHHVPGPDPLLRFCQALEQRCGLARARTRPLQEAAEGFRSFLREEVGDRSALSTLISSWLPEARTEFELRRKQTLFRAMSQLKGVCADTNLGTVLLHPSVEPGRVDVVWVFGLLGIRRLRPGAPVKLTSRRLGGEAQARRPCTLEGCAIEDLEGLRLDRFCHAPPAEAQVHHAGETVHYLLAGEQIGLRSPVDLILAEVNRSEMERDIPASSGRRAYVFSEVGTPCRALSFDVVLFDDVYAGPEPSLHVYDTSLEGVASANDRSRDVDRLALSEKIVPLGPDPTTWRMPEFPEYVPLVHHVLDAMGWTNDSRRAYRCRVDFPIYGSQVMMAFEPRTPAP